MLAKVDLAFARASADGKSLSPEMTLLLALVMFDGFEVFPAFDMIPEANPPHQAISRDERAIEVAKLFNTYNKIDRSAQYQGQFTPRQQQNNIDTLFEKLRIHERSQFRHKVLLLLLSAAVAILEIFQHAMK